MQVKVSYIDRRTEAAVNRYFHTALGAWAYKCQLVVTREARNMPRIFAETTTGWQEILDDV